MHVQKAGRLKNTEKGQGHPKGQDLQEDQDHIHQSLERKSIFLQKLDILDILDTIEGEVEDTINRTEGSLHLTDKSVLRSGEIRVIAFPDPAPLHQRRDRHRRQGGSHQNYQQELLGLSA